MRKIEDLTGKVFNRATVLKCYSKMKESGATAGFCDCVCTCGELFTAASYELKTGRVKSCGCLRSERMKNSINRGKNKGKK